MIGHLHDGDALCHHSVMKRYQTETLLPGYNHAGFIRD